MISRRNCRASMPSEDGRVAMSDVSATPPTPATRQIIQRYGNGGFRIAGEQHTGSCLVLPDRTSPWVATTVEGISVTDFQPILDELENVQVLLVGCGQRFTAPPTALAAALRERGVMMEWMDTGAACRTFNVLLSEDRPVAAALIAV